MSQLPNIHDPHESIANVVSHMVIESIKNSGIDYGEWILYIETNSAGEAADVFIHKVLTELQKHGQS